MVWERGCERGCPYLWYSAEKMRYICIWFLLAPFTHQKCLVFLWWPVLCGTDTFHCSGTLVSKQPTRQGVSKEKLGMRLGSYIPSHVLKQSSPLNGDLSVCHVLLHLLLATVAPHTHSWFQFTLYHIRFLKQSASRTDLHMWNWTTRLSVSSRLSLLRPRTRAEAMLLPEPPVFFTCSKKSLGYMWKNLALVSY